MSLGSKVKDPLDVRKFSFDWREELGADTIATSSFVLDSGITAGATSSAGGITTVMISGGTNGSDYRVTNIITKTTSLETVAKSGTLQVRTQ